MQSTKKKMLTRLVGLALAGVATFASAQSSEGTQGGVSAHYGIGDHYQRFTLSYETPSIWTYQFGGNSVSYTHLTLPTTPYV